MEKLDYNPDSKTASLYLKAEPTVGKVKNRMDVARNEGCKPDGCSSKGQRAIVFGRFEDVKIFRQSRRDYRCITVRWISHGIEITIRGATKWVNNIGFTTFRAVWVELGRLFHGITSRGYAHQIPAGFGILS